ncbi:MAG: hypothetical protein JRI96_15255 [Deltaproteobacteria bacterium]|nr:hypothetical protein [Deltaproteobacteria bacterium]
MGKVGSRTIFKSLKKLRLGVPIYHAHRLNPESLKYAKLYVKRTFPEIVYLAYEKYFWQHIEDRKLSITISQSPKSERWSIITLVRDPIARNISCFFQTIDRRFLNFYKRVKEGLLTINKLVYTFYEKEDHKLPLNWFDVEIKPLFGIDVFSSTFPKSKGYKIYRSRKADLLVIKLEKLSECANKAFKEFLNIKKVKLISSNIAENKDYSYIYQEFIKNITFPRRYLDMVYDSKLAKHFYSKGEINKFKATWEQLPDKKYNKKYKALRMRRF